MSGAGLDQVRRDIELRVKTDRTISSLWLLLPAASLLSVLAFLGYIVSLVLVQAARGTNDTGSTMAAIFGVSSYVLVAGFTILILMLFLIYRLIARRNDHFRREQGLFTDLVSYLTNEASSRDLAAEFQARVAPAQTTLDEIKSKERYREALVWVIVGFFISVVLLFVYYFLMKDFYRHERREEAFLEELAAAASVIGINISFTRRARQLPNRSFALYFVLTIFTVGLFWFYWLYRLIKDPNMHFASQWVIEDALFASMSGDGYGLPMRPA